MWSAKETSQGRKQDLGARIVASLRLGPRKQSIEEVRNWKYLPSAGCLCLVISDSHQKSKAHKAERRREGTSRAHPFRRPGYFQPEPRAFLDMKILFGLWIM
jgi:hypothetical protein